MKSMELDNETQRLVLAICGLLTVAILGVDLALFKWVGNHATISGACGYMFDRSPVTYTLFVAWLGILIGHLMPTR